MHERLIEIVPWHSILLTSLYVDDDERGSVALKHHNRHEKLNGVEAEGVHRQDEGGLDGCTPWSSEIETLEGYLFKMFNGRDDQEVGLVEADSWIWLLTGGQDEGVVWLVVDGELLPGFGNDNTKDCIGVKLNNQGGLAIEESGASLSPVVFEEVYSHL